jgi:hypothetical protein
MQSIRRRLDVVERRANGRALEVEPSGVIAPVEAKGEQNGRA